MMVDIKYLSGGNLLKLYKTRPKNPQHIIPAFKNFVLIKQVQKVH